MRSFLTLIAGGPGRVAVSAAGIVTCGFILDGRGDALLRAVFVTAVWGSAFVLAFLTLCVLAAACGIDVEGAVAKPQPKEADHGEA